MNDKEKLYKRIQEIEVFKKETLHFLQEKKKQLLY